MTSTFELADQLERAKRHLEVRGQELARLVRRAQMSSRVANRELRALHKHVQDLRRALEAKQLPLFVLPGGAEER